MSSILTHTGDEPVILNAQALRRLLERGDGDAALLYLALLRHHGTLSPRALTQELHWTDARTNAAEQTLRQLELITPDIEQPDTDAEPEEQDYQQSEIAFVLENDAEFRQLSSEVESRLGRRLSPVDLSRLLGLFHTLGLPSDVIYTLVNHCIERNAARYGTGRRLAMSAIEKTGHRWSSMGIDTQAAAVEYLRRYAQREDDYADYMRVLHLGDRPPVKMEESYLAAWKEMEFPTETIALAYEKTVFACHEFKWHYCNRILERWHDAGWHTVEEVEKQDRPKKKTVKKTKKAAENEVRKYAQQLKKQRERKKTDGGGSQ